MKEKFSSFSLFIQFFTLFCATSVAPFPGLGRSPPWGHGRPTRENLGTCSVPKQAGQVGRSFKQNFVTYDMLLVFTLYPGTPPLFGLLCSTNFFNRRLKEFHTTSKSSIFPNWNFLCYLTFILEICCWIDAWQNCQRKVCLMKHTSNVPFTNFIFDLFLQMVTRTKKIFVGGLSAPSTLEDVKNYFEQFGRVSLSFICFFLRRWKRR